MDYLDFVPAIATRGQIKTFIDSDSGIQQQEGKLMTVFAAWWQLHAPGLGELPKTKKVMELRAEFLSSFVDSLQPVGLLDRFKVAGVVASWWDEVKYELRTLSLYKEIKKQLAQAKGILRTLKKEVEKRLSAKRAVLTDEDCQGLVLAIFKDGLTAELERYVTAHRQQVIVEVENWWDKYRVTLQDIEAQRDAASQRLSEFLHSLGYTN